ncbi:MAG: DUF4058 family protein [Pirellulaceae bacterium]|nr:DUF4058 family protein [Pirellulaceae bacterium]
MPMLDHFRPPTLNKGSWEGFHGMWPALIVIDLCKLLPERYVAEPRVHLGKNFEIDVCTFDVQGRTEGGADSSGPSSATATWAPPEPTLTLELDPTEHYEYEVLIFDQARGRELVAAIELVSPANKDRPETRQAFVSKCAALLQKKICVSIVDLVTVKHYNLYCEVLDVFGQADPAFAVKPPSTYAVTCRSHSLATRSRFETWAYPMLVGQRLPILPIWLDNDQAISLDLEVSYQQTCSTLRLI